MKIKNVMASLCCQNNSHVNKTWIIQNFHLTYSCGKLFLIHLLMPTKKMLKGGKYTP